VNSNYSIVIQWSQKNNCFVASLREWNNQNTNGKSYEEALANAQKMLATLIKLSASQGQSLPQAKTFQIASVVQ